MIKMGFNTLAMLTYGLGVRLPWYAMQVGRKPKPQIEFRNKPVGIVAEDTTGPTSFSDGMVEFQKQKVEFEDR